MLLRRDALNLATALLVLLQTLRCEFRELLDGGFDSGLNLDGSDSVRVEVIGSQGHQGAIGTADEPLQTIARELSGSQNDVPTVRLVVATASEGEEGRACGDRVTAIEVERRGTC